MTLTISELQEQLTAKFNDVQRVDTSVLRFVRSAAASPFAVYYLDLTDSLPQTVAALTAYQDRVIGRHYFDGPASLQWSNYLYFVTSAERLADTGITSAKNLIERDRTYARKFVISEDELPSILDNRVVEAPAVRPHENVLSLWTDRLTRAGLDSAVFSNDDLPTRLRLIEASTAPLESSLSPARHTTRLPAALGLRQIDLTRYRQFPLQRSFAFGTANLIVGPNGTGKTSLLEAIELFYCGKNKRNPDVFATYDLRAVLSNGATETVTHSRDLQTLRNRNLSWYGVPEVNTWKLYSSFARFNFLDTDAAVELADSTSDIEEDLSKLLVGPDASKTWRDIERVDDAVASQLRELEPLQALLVEQIEQLTRQPDALTDASGESQDSAEGLRVILQRLGWLAANDDEQDWPPTLLERLPELVTVAEQSTSLSWIPSPVTIGSLNQYCEAARTIEAFSSDILKQLDERARTQNELLDAISRGREASALLLSALRLVEADLPERLRERENERASIATCSGRLAGLDADALASAASAHSALTVTAFAELTSSTLSTAEAALAAARHAHLEFTQRREELVTLGQQLRNTAERLLLLSGNTNECPLCHSTFAEGELERHIGLGVDFDAEHVGRTLLAQIELSEEALKKALSHEAAASWLVRFCAKALLPLDTPLTAALREVTEVQRTLGDSSKRVKELDAELKLLDDEGFTGASLDSTIARLNDLGHSLNPLNRQTVDALLAEIGARLDSASKDLEANKRTADALRHQLEEALRSSVANEPTLDAAVSNLRERLPVAEGLLARLRDLVERFPWPDDRPLSELALEASTARSLASELQAALARTRAKRSAQDESAVRREALAARERALQPRIRRLREAKATLTDLREHHSLLSAMNTTLQENRAAVEHIFARIHSPAEFSGLGSSLTKLVRKNEPSEATLSQISTGQRAAFALAVFLAQNAQLRMGPPVLLIDDPIAHIDDLNCLSFLDYLREIALTGHRQIFFATASDKLANLFERKFEFLGPDGFHRFDLSRTRQAARSS